MLNEARAILAALKADPDDYAVAFPIYKALLKTFYKTLAFLMTEEEVEAAYRQANGIPDFVDLSDYQPFQHHVLLNYHQVDHEFIDKDIYNFFPFDLEVDARQWLSAQGLTSTEKGVIAQYEAWISKRDLQVGLAAELTSNPTLRRKRKI